MENPSWPRLLWIKRGLAGLEAAEGPREAEQGSTQPRGAGLLRSGAPSEQRATRPRALIPLVRAPGANKELFGKAVLGGERQQTGRKFFPAATFIFTLVIPTTSTTPAKKQGQLKKNKQRTNRKTQPRHATRTAGVWKITWWRHTCRTRWVYLVIVLHTQNTLLQWDPGRPTRWAAGSSCLHHRLHVVQAVVPPQVGGLQTCVDLSSLLKLDDLLGCLRDQVRDSAGEQARVDEKANQS